MLFNMCSVDMFENIIRTNQEYYNYSDLKKIQILHEKDLPVQFTMI